MTSSHSAAGFVLPLLAALLLLDASPALAQAAKVTVEVDRTRLNVGEELELTVKVSGRYEDLNIPATPGFDVVGQRFTQINRQVSRTYVLRSKTAGTFTIGAASAILEGRVVAQSQPITITVEPPATAKPVEAAAERDLSSLEQETVFVRWATDRDRYYVGEPFVMTLELWMAQGLASRQAELVQAAKMEGLLVEDLPRQDNRDTVRKIIGRKPFSVHPLMRAVATPLKSGKVLIDPTTVRLAVAEDDWAMVSRTVTRSTQPYWLEVAELPRQGRPQGMGGNHVGRFTMKTSLRDDRNLEPRQVRTGQRLVLRAEISGQGNLQGLQAPTVKSDGSWEVSLLPGSAEDRVTRGATGISGTRVFQWIAAPKEPGLKEVPIVSLSFYDPQLGRYETLRSEAASLEVTGEASAAQTFDAATLGEDVGPIFTEADLSRRRSAPWVSRSLYWIGLGVVLLAFVAVELRHRQRQRDAASPGRRKARRAHGEARARLKGALAGAEGEAYAQIHRALAGYIEARTEIPAGGLTLEVLRTRLLAAGCPEELLGSLLQTLEACEVGRYAPKGQGQTLSELAGRAEGLLDALERVTFRRVS